MNRKDFFFQQPVTEGEMNDAFQGVEDAIDQVVQDLLSTRGIIAGGNVVPTTPTSRAIRLDSSWRVRDGNGRRIVWGSGGQVVQLLKDYAGADIIATAGNHKIAAVFVAFDRALSDARTDGNGDVVQFSRDESYRFVVVQGVETPTTSPLSFPNAPVGYEAAVRVADVRIVGNPSTIGAGDIIITKQQKASFNVFGDDVTLQKSLTVSGAITTYSSISAASANISSWINSNSVSATSGSFGSINLDGTMSSFGLDYVEVKDVHGSSSPLLLDIGPGVYLVNAQVAGGSVYLALPDPGSVPGKVLTLKRIGDSEGTSGYVVQVGVDSSGTIDGAATYKLSKQDEVLQVVACDGTWRRLHWRESAAAEAPLSINLTAAGYDVKVTDPDVVLVSAPGDQQVRLPDPSICVGKRFVVKNFGPSEFHLWANFGKFDRTATDNVVIYAPSIAGNISSLTVVSDGTSWIRTAKYVN